MLNNSINLNFLIGINIVKNEKVHKIAEGNTAEIFEIDDKKVLKLFKMGYSKSTVYHEY